MPFVVTTMRSMERKITLETLAANIADLTSLVSAQGVKLDNLNDKVDARGGKLDSLSAKLDAQGAKIKAQGAKIDRIDLTTQAIQEDVEGIHEEMKGIHKVLDQFDGRTTRLEIHAGFPIESVEG